jgi:AraC-like DNA-binding protein
MTRTRHLDTVVIRTLAVGYSGGYTIPTHSHDWSQLIYASTGVMTVHTAAGSWVVPPERGVWVPAGIAHSIEMSGQVSMRSLYFAPGFGRGRLPRTCSVLNVSGLMRELILHATTLRSLDRKITAQARLIGVILDQIKALPEMPLDLAMPRDGRALRVAEMLRANPGSSGSLDRIARAAGASKRTIERRFRSETGMGLGRWRQQLRLLHALRLLAGGEPVTAVALDAGYQSTSAFISMFKKALGSTPLRYRSGSR